MITIEDIKNKGFVKTYKIYDRIGYSKGRIIIKFLPKSGTILDMIDYSDINSPKTLVTDLSDKEKFNELHESIIY